MTCDARISVDFFTHHKTKKLHRRVGDSGVLRCIRLFLFCATNRTDGVLHGMDSEDIEIAVEWDGECGEWVQAMVDVGFLEKNYEDEQILFSVKNWGERNPWASGARARSMKAKWNAVKRHHGEAAADSYVPDYAAIRCKSDASSMLVALHDSKSSNAPSPSPSPYLLKENIKRKDFPSDDGTSLGGSKKCNFETFVSLCRESGESAIPRTDSVFKFCEDAGIPVEYVHLAWVEFKRAYGKGGSSERKMQKGVKGWRLHFGNAVRRNWFKLWYDRGGEWDLTSTGKAIQRARDNGDE